MKNATANDNSGKPDASKVARPVWGWGRAVTSSLHHYNLTRLYTLAARQAGGQGVLSVGRVQTPILGLVVRRDRENAGHQKQNYYDITATFNIGGLIFPAKYKPDADAPVDEKGRINDKTHADAIAATVEGKPATIAEASTSVKDTPPPLPYNLLKLQTDAARLYGLKPDKVKDITQNLREKYRLITYNRSDCQYLSEEQHADAPGVLSAISTMCQDFASVPLALLMDPSRKSRAFDSSKVTAHHAIIPTAATADFSQLSKDEQRIYTLIARAYIAQFMEPYRYEQTNISVISETHEFTCQSHIPISAGWKTLYGKSEVNDDALPSDSESLTTSLKDLAAGNSGNCDSAKVDTKETKPRPLYTMASLLTDLTKVAQYVKDDATRKLLIDKDKGKAGENGGIGTPATRDSIIALLFQRGFIEEKKSGKTTNIVSTTSGQELYDALPDTARFPDMTAIWHGQQKDIEAGKMDIATFIAGLLDYLSNEVTRVKANGLGVKWDIHPCPACGKAMRQLKGKKGLFWGCSDYPTCKATLPDDNGKPGEHISDEDAPKCPDCGKPLRLRKGKNGAFFGCSGFPSCNVTVKAENGKPVESSASDVSQVHICMVCGKGLVRRRANDGKRFWWGCSGYPKCKQTYPDIDGQPNYNTVSKTA